MYNARIAGLRGSMTAAVYQRDGAEDVRLDFSWVKIDCSSIHSNGEKTFHDI
jgi:hypothetical protein